MVVFNYEDTLTGSVEKLQDAFSELGVSASSSVAAIAQAMKAMIGMSSEYTSSLADAYSVIGGNGYSHAVGAQSKACGDNSYAIGWQNVGITVNDNDRNTIFSIHTDTPEKPMKLIKENDNPFYIDPEVIQQGGWLDSGIDE